MFTIENLVYHCCDNGTRIFYSASLVNEIERLDVTFSQSGDIIVAYEPSTNLIHRLMVPESVHSIEDLCDGDNVDILNTIEESIIRY